MNVSCFRLIPLLLLTLTPLRLGADDSARPILEWQYVFPFDQQHNHAPGIVECPNGDILVSWYRGSGERQADDVAVWGARLRKGTRHWSRAFIMADRPGFPDCNTCMMIDSRKRLWLFWPTILANTWESCITNVRISSRYTDDGPPKWDHQDVILLKPKADYFTKQYRRLLEAAIEQYRDQLTDELRREIDVVRTRLDDTLYQRLGWQPRCKPTVLPSGRILMPLYSDTYSVSIMAISDDEGKTWRASQPLLGLGNIQPIVLRRSNGTLVAYMRENGITGKIRVCESTDDGEHWGEVTSSSLPNPGAGIDAVRLANGHWVLVYNDSATSRHRLAVALSDDEGRTWKWKRLLENDRQGRFHYPAVIQAADGAIHAVYSYHVPQGKTMKHIRFTESWIRQKGKRP